MGITKISKVLVVFVAAASVSMAGFAAVSLMTATNWKAKTQEIQTLVKAQKDKIDEIDPQIARWENQTKDAQAAIAADIPAIQAREKLYASQLADLNQKISELTKQIVAAGQKATKIGDEAKLQREVGRQLSNQLAELRSQRSEAEEEKRRLTDQLVQAKGILERATRRNQVLVREFGSRVPAYDELKPSPAEKQPAAEDAAPEDKPAAEKPEVDKTDTEKPAAEDQPKSDDEKKPDAEEKPTEEKPAAEEKPAEEKSSDQ